MYTLLEQIRIQLDKYDVDSETNDVVFPQDRKLEIKLENLISKAKNDVIAYRHYPSSYDDEMIAKDIEERYSNIVLDLVMYDYSTDGANFETNHAENGINRTFVKRESILGKVIPFCNVL